MKDNEKNKDSLVKKRVNLEALRKFSELSPDVRVIYGHEQ